MTVALSITPNLPELKRLNMWVQAQDQLELGARIWDQDDWVTSRDETPMCQTAYCVAGMAITRAGHRFDRVHGRRSTSAGVWYYTDWMELDGEHITTNGVADKAAEILGLYFEVADELFEATNTAAQIDRQIRQIFKRAGADYDATEPAPDLEIEIKAAEAVRPQLCPTINV